MASYRKLKQVITYAVMLSNSNAPFRVLVKPAGVDHYDWVNRQTDSASTVQAAVMLKLQTDESLHDVAGKSSKKRKASAITGAGTTGAAPTKRKKRRSTKAKKTTIFAIQKRITDIRSSRNIAQSGLCDLTENT